MGRVIPLKMAKPTADDYERMQAFFQGIEEILDHHRDPETGEYLESVDSFLAEFVGKLWGRRGPGVSTAWRRVVWGGQVAIENACDPNEDVLEWKPEIAAAMQAAGLAEAAS